jgi:hypothetical protein
MCATDAASQVLLGLVRPRGGGRGWRTQSAHVQGPAAAWLRRTQRRGAVAVLQLPGGVETDSPSLFAQEQHLGRFVLNAYGVKAAARTSSAEAVRPYHES